MNLKEIAQQFVDWTKRKIRHHTDEKKDVYFREKEVWWAALGKNVGYEVDGKHELFERPVLIVKKYSKDICFVLPLTTQIKNPKPWYQIVIEIEEVSNAVNISQGKTISSKRLLRKSAMIETEVYNNIVDQFIGTFKSK
ncbi:MAG TPA: type II toxin-antitoxin system PemK/MazF family toxin [Candidatus Magasanikbacteria bacterium]|nr:type II toxin-antitoxin system PemK/MazF family toxin [Candidatus Magasanikbacteria bacterium]